MYVHKSWKEGICNTDNMKHSSIKLHTAYNPNINSMNFLLLLDLKLIVVKILKIHFYIGFEQFHILIQKELHTVDLLFNKSHALKRKNKLFFRNFLFYKLKTYKSF